jgi:hypothetical protein
MNFILDFSKKAHDTLKSLKEDKSQEPLLKSIEKALDYLAAGQLGRKGTSKLTGQTSDDGRELWHSRANDDYRICWVYNTPKPSEDIPKPQGRILIVSIGPHDHYKR